MAKTQWTNGSHITPSFMQAFAGTNALQGHAHDGADADGSVPKILLTSGAHVQGTLPLTNINSYSDGTVNVKITTSYVTEEQSTVWRYMVLADYVHIYCHDIFGTSNSSDLEITPDSSWPSNILSTNAKYCNIVVSDDNNLHPGLIYLPTVGHATDNAVCHIYDSTTNGYIDNGWQSSGTKGIVESTIMYYKD